MDLCLRLRVHDLFKGLDDQKEMLLPWNAIGGRTCFLNKNMFAGIGIDIALLMNRHNHRSWGMWMDFSFFGLGASFSVEGGLSSADGALECKLLFSGEKLSNDQGAEGFVNVFRNAMSGNGTSGLSESELPVVLPPAGKLLPVSSDRAMEEMEIPADYAGFGMLPFRGDGETDTMPEESLAGMFSPFTADSPRFQAGEHQTALPGALSETSRVRASLLSVEGSMKPAMEEAIPEQLVVRAESLNQPLSRSSAPGSVEDAVLPERRNVLFPDTLPVVSHDRPRMPGSHRLTADGPASVWREAGMQGEASSSRIPGNFPNVSHQDPPAGEAGGNTGLFPVTDRKEIRLQMAGNPVPPEIHSGNTRKDSPLPAHENLKGQSADMFKAKRDGAAPVVDAGPARPAAEPSSRPAIALQSVGAVQAAVSHLQLPRTGDGKAEVMLRGKDGSAMMPGNPSFQLQMPEKTLAESVVLAGARSSNTDKRLDSSLSAQVFEDGEGSLAMTGTRQSPVQGTAMPGTGTAGVLPRQTEISVPLGHAAWEQSLTRQVLQAGQGQLRQLHIKLNPSNLGSIDIKLQVEGDSTNIAFSSQHAVVREAVEASLPRLREMFSGSGINLGNVDVGGQDTARGQEREAQGGEFSPGNLFGGGDEGEQGGSMDNGVQSRKGKDDNQLLDYYV